MPAHITLIQFLFSALPDILDRARIDFAADQRSTGLLLVLSVAPQLQRLIAAVRLLGVGLAIARQLYLL